MLRWIKNRVENLLSQWEKWTIDALKGMGYDLLLLPWNWVCGLWKDMTGPIGYRGITVVVAAYAGAYAIIESNYERQMNLAISQRNHFITIASSGNRASFVGAMKNFGPIQAMYAYVEPSLFEPWDWWESAQPNAAPLLSWARYHLEECRAEECGNGRRYRIDLNRADLQNSILVDVDLYLSDLRHANLRWADLTMAELEEANLFRAELQGANLTRAELKEAKLRRADLQGADLTMAELEQANLSRADLRGAILTKADLAETDLSRADLRGAIGLECGQLSVAQDWQLACRNVELACGEAIPVNACD